MVRCFTYDYKFSGEHRVRLVFNGARQSPSTYTETFAPTVRAESVRLFHIYSVEYGFHINQFDVPQAFLFIRLVGIKSFLVKS